jgi:hypothetical protein
LHAALVQRFEHGGRNLRAARDDVRIAAAEQLRRTGRLQQGIGLLEQLRRQVQEVRIDAGDQVQVFARIAAACAVLRVVRGHQRQRAAGQHRQEHAEHLFDQQAHRHDRQVIERAGRHALQHVRHQQADRLVADLHALRLRRRTGRMDDPADARLDPLPGGCARCGPFVALARGVNARDAGQDRTDARGRLRILREDRGGLVQQAADLLVGKLDRHRQKHRLHAQDREHRRHPRVARARGNTEHETAAIAVHLLQLAADPRDVGAQLVEQYSRPSISRTTMRFGASAK